MAQQGNRGLDDYVQVHERVTKFRADHPKGRILTTILDGESLTVRAEIYFEGNESTIPNATAHASEDGGMAGRKSSAVEKTETAAVGRALAFCGYEIKQGIASREEMQRAQRQPTGQTSNVTTMPARADDKLPTDAQLSLDIIGGADALGYKDMHLNAWVKKEFGGEDGWRKRPREQKEWLYDGLRKLADKQAAGAKA